MKTWEPELANKMKARNVEKPPLKTAEIVNAVHYEGLVKSSEKDDQNHNQAVHGWL